MLSNYFNNCKSMICILFLLLCLTDLTFSFTFNSGPKLIDLNGEANNIEQIAEQLVCDKKNAGKQLINRISTIVRLADLFESANNAQKNSPFYDKNANCIQENYNPIHELKEILISSIENACSDEKISLIEQFHQKYVSTVEDDVAQRKENNIQELSKQLKFFFIYYAMEVGTICKKNLINNLEWDLKDKITEDDYKLTISSSSDSTTSNNFDKIMFGVCEHFSAMREVNSYDDIIMLWNIIDGSLLAKENAETIGATTFGDNLEINNITGESIKLYIKSKNVKTMQALQMKCFKKFKPIYDKLILPIIRLSDLGYSYTNVESFDKELKELNQNKLVKRWYIITQICETVLPIKFIVDESISNDEETIMITREEADKLSQENYIQNLYSEHEDDDDDDDKTIQYEPTTNSMVGLDVLSLMESDLITSKNSNEILKSVQSNLTARDRSIRRAISRFAKSAFAFIKDKTGLFFLSKHNDNDNYVKEDLHEMITNSLSNVDEQKLLSIKGSIVNKNTKPKHHNKIERIKNRPRVWNVDAEKSKDKEQLSYKHTKSLANIFNGWYSAFKSIVPSRMVILFIGTVICLILILVIVIASIT